MKTAKNRIFFPKIKKIRTRGESTKNMDSKKKILKKIQIIFIFFVVLQYGNMTT